MAMAREYSCSASAWRPTLFNSTARLFRHAATSGWLPPSAASLMSSTCAHMGAHAVSPARADVTTHWTIFFHHYACTQPHGSNGPPSEMRSHVQHLRACAVSQAAAMLLRFHMQSVLACGLGVLYMGIFRSSESSEPAFLRAAGSQNGNDWAEGDLSDEKIFQFHFMSGWGPYRAVNRLGLGEFGHGFQQAGRIGHCCRHFRVCGPQLHHLCTCQQSACACMGESQKKRILSLCEHGSLMKN